MVSDFIKLQVFSDSGSLQLECGYWDCIEIWLGLKFFENLAGSRMKMSRFTFRPFAFYFRASHKQGVLLFIIRKYRCDALFLALEN